MSQKRKIFFQHLVLIVLVIWLASNLSFVWPVEAGILDELAVPSSDYLPGQVLVMVEKSRLGDAEIEQIIQRESPVPLRTIQRLHPEELQTKAEPHNPRLFTIHFNERIDPALVSRHLSQHPLFTAEPEYLGYGTILIDDPYFQYQWGLQQIEGPRAFALEQGEPSIVIGVIDTGVDQDHEDLISKLLPGWDAKDEDFDPEDDHGHGTRMTGIAAAATNNGLGVAGTCPRCRLLPIRAGYNNNGVATFSTGKVFRALEYAVGNPRQVAGIPDNPYPVNVISMSFAFSNPSTFLLWGVQDAHQAGAVLVAAAGNDNSSDETYPAAYPEVIAVAATDQNDVKANFSNYGDWVDVAAPGVSIYTTSLENSYAYSTGTSPATPFVAGTIGLMLSYGLGEEVTSEDIRTILINTSDLVTGFPEIIGGRINAYQAVVTTPHLSLPGGKFLFERI